jgi:hypothetical protein
MRYELGAYEWSVIGPMLPHKPRWSCDQVRRGAICRRTSVPIPPATIVLVVGVGDGEVTFSKDDPAPH